MICAVTGRWGGKCCGHDIADDEWFIQATAHAQKVMGVSMRIMSHAVEGQDSNLINNSCNTEEIEYNCDQSINQTGLVQGGSEYWAHLVFEWLITTPWLKSLLFRPPFE